MAVLKNAPGLEVPKATSMYWKSITALWNAREIFLTALCLTRLARLLQPWNNTNTALPFTGLTASQIKATLFQAHLGLARILSFCDPVASVDRYISALECRYFDGAPDTTIPDLLKASANMSDLEHLFALHQNCIQKHVYPSADKQPPADKKSALEMLLQEAARYSSGVCSASPAVRLAAVSFHFLAASVAVIASRTHDAVQGLRDLGKMFEGMQMIWVTSDLCGLAAGLAQGKEQAALLLEASVLAIEAGDRVRAKRMEMSLREKLKDEGWLEDSDRDMIKVTADVLQASYSLDGARLKVDLEIRLDELEDALA
ncbi:hypothetical protein BC829DRAFT_381413, partial [Chytridium lagenaria]